MSILSVFVDLQVRLCVYGDCFWQILGVSGLLPARVVDDDYVWANAATDCFDGLWRGETLHLLVAPINYWPLISKITTQGVPRLITCVFPE